jgi:hypothetical protein
MVTGMGSEMRFSRSVVHSEYCCIHLYLLVTVCCSFVKESLCRASCCSLTLHLTNYYALYQYIHIFGGYISVFNAAICNQEA